MIKQSSGRRTLLLAAGTAVVTAVAGAASPQARDVRGTIEFEGGALIPKGALELSISDPASRDAAEYPVAAARIDSDGGSKAMEFSLSFPAGLEASDVAQVVARLERADGWLLARGSAKVDTGSAVHITLYTVMY